jgi:hypothetical protein
VDSLLCAPLVAAAGFFVPVDPRRGFALVILASADGVMAGGFRPALAAVFVLLGTIRFFEDVNGSVTRVVRK